MTDTTLDKTFEPARIEARHYPRMEATGAFTSTTEGNAQPFCVMMPPPNVTGVLHMGHAFTMTLQDILTRYHRAKGRAALWQPGTDHAGIATQMVVERQLAAAGTSRQSLGREAFVERVWQWKAESGGTITEQLKRLGASCDWDRERFTMDEGLSRAVTKVFVELYNQGLIYKDKRLVNWDPKLHTAISDLEVETREVKGSLWYIDYPIEGSDRVITVATTRPETMLGDTGVAVHPDDERYQDLIGRFAILPLTGRRIRIVGDTYSDPEKGTGAVKITPAHDFNDFEVGRRHQLAQINILDRNGCLDLAGNAAFLEGLPPADAEAAIRAFHGHDRSVVRERVVELLTEQGRLNKIEPHTNQVPHGDRSGVVIEPWLTDQWYCDAATLAKGPIAAVEDGRTVFVPKNWENTFFEWMRNIQPWCISRQLWWGHQIPAWYGPDGHVFVAGDEVAAQGDADRHYGQPTALTRDADVLDTWFSSALWPFSTLGWPDQTAHLQRYYPGDVLVTGFDIIFFWVARMMMMGMHFMGDVPFRTVYIHALVRDERGQKMSKSKGNIIDPLDLIERYGCDALRFTMAALAAPGRDIKLAPARVEGYRNFATKLWNANRYARMNGCVLPEGWDPASATLAVNRWIIGEVVATEAKLTQAIEAYRFNDAAASLYQFAWNTLCDWYLEFTKPILTGDAGAAQTETRATTAWALEQVLRLLNPIMPFITEELWGEERAMLLETSWPVYPPTLVDHAATDELGWLVRLITAVRALRAELNVPAGTQLGLAALSVDEGTAQRITQHGPALQRLARVEAPTLVEHAVPGTVQLVQDGVTWFLDLKGSIDTAAESTRLGKDVARLEKDMAKLDAKLANADFRAKADPAVIEDTEERRTETADQIARLRVALERLQVLG